MRRLPLLLILCFALASAPACQQAQFGGKKKSVTFEVEPASAVEDGVELVVIQNSVWYQRGGQQRWEAYRGALDAGSGVGAERDDMWSWAQQVTKETYAPGDTAVLMDYASICLANWNGVLTQHSFVPGEDPRVVLDLD